MGKAAINGGVSIGIRRRIPIHPGTYKFKHSGQKFKKICSLILFTVLDLQRVRTPPVYPYNVTVTRREDEGFGFVIISSLNRSGSTIGKFPSQENLALGRPEHEVSTVPSSPSPQRPFWILAKKKFPIWLKYSKFFVHRENNQGQPSGAMWATSRWRPHTSS